MNPNKNNLLNVMKHIASTYYFLDKFERRDDESFIENTAELTKVGNEMFENFGIKDTNISFFIDICAAPGMYSKQLIEDKDATGVGISLPPEKGGVKFLFSHKNYKVFYKDILEKQYKLDLPKELDFGIASCVSYIDDRKNSYKLNIELILTSMNIILTNLKKGGNMIINMTMKNIFICFNILDIIMEQFDNIKLWKSYNVWGTKNTFYIFCYGYKKAELINMIQYINMIKDDKNKFNYTYTGSQDHFNKITEMMNEIYMTRITVWLNIINTVDSPTKRF